MSRVFFVRVNLDDLGADLDTIGQDQYGEWLAGFRAGSRGRFPAGWDGARLMGAEFGKLCYASAEVFRASRSAGGKARQAIGKSAHAQHMLNTCSADAQHEGQLSSIQYPVSNTQTSTAAAAASFVVPEKSTPPSPKAAAADAAAGSLDWMDDMQHAPPMREFAPRVDWNLWRQTHPRLYLGRSDEDGSVGDWRALFDRAGVEVMDAMYQGCLPGLANNRHGIGFKAALAWINENTESA